MKNILITIFLIILSSCNGQDKDSPAHQKEKIMNSETIDLGRFKNYPDVITEANENNMPKMEDTLSDGTVVKYSKWENKEDGYKIYYRKMITPLPPSLFYTIKDFYPSGIIEQETNSFIGTLAIPPFYNSLSVKEYDVDGNLKKTEVNSGFDANMKVKFKDLLSLLQKEAIITNVKDQDKEKLRFHLFDNQIDINEITPERIIQKLAAEKYNGKILNANSDVERRNITISLEANFWKVTKDIYPFGYFDYTIDANTGVVKSTSYREDKRP
ncbi:hypothetical protein [Halpernia frigidisoli]|uniref:PepSY domain-containing protein n=1 Tax=Halpernia frigidisoli TaxID=1125876 RepID=A0A1I3IN83_9FLAO|nr:hypothetical protein [Halpernia frigidisoli]SFI49431.1 hypothetical protein SAMN05443292_2707 [Halpernia frigidisoli]